MQNWRSGCVESRKLCTYRDFKIDFCKEPYLNIIDIGKFRKCMGSFRFSSHDLMIENGMYYMLLIEDRICVYCENDNENDINFVLKCPLYNEIRLIVLLSETSLCTYTMGLR